MISLEHDTLRLAGGEVQLSLRGMRLAAALMRAQGSVVSHAGLMNTAWPGLPQDHRLRHALRQEVHLINGASRDLGMAVMISSAKNVGYAWSPTEE